MQVCKRCGEKLKRRMPTGQCEDCERLYPTPKLEVGTILERE